MSIHPVAYERDDGVRLVKLPSPQPYWTLHYIWEGELWVFSKAQSIWLPKEGTVQDQCCMTFVEGMHVLTNPSFRNPESAGYTRGTPAKPEAT